MQRILNLFKKKEKEQPQEKSHIPIQKLEKVAERKGVIGEHKIDIQLSQLSSDYKYLNDVMIENSKSISGFTQIDHLVLTQYGIFVIETKNYQGTLYGGKSRKTWLINGKFKMQNPLIQNYGHIQALKSLIDQKYHKHFISLVTFTKRCTLKIDLEIRDINSNEMVIYDIYLLETIKRKISRAKIMHKDPFISHDEIMDIYQAISTANISKPEVRELHNQRIRSVTKEKGKSSTKAKCVVCHKEVSEKVEKFCLTNKRFKGKIYCFNHQKQM